VARLPLFAGGRQDCCPVPTRSPRLHAATSSGGISATAYPGDTGSRRGSPSRYPSGCTGRGGRGSIAPILGHPGQELISICTPIDLQRPRVEPRWRIMGGSAITAQASAPPRRLDRPVLQHRLVAQRGRTLGDGQISGGHRVLHPVIRCDESGSRMPYHRSDRACRAVNCGFFSIATQPWQFPAAKYAAA